jgi:hypothetical protein
MFITTGTVKESEDTSFGSPDCRLDYFQSFVLSWDDVSGSRVQRSVIGFLSDKPAALNPTADVPLHAR